MKKIILIIALNIAFFNLITAQKTTNAAFDALINAKLSKTVPQITAEQLHTRIYTKNENFTILDTREPAEYNVSHLAKAINVGYDKFDIKTLANLDKKTPIVVYCSIGYRSERVGEKLFAAGFLKVFNLYGGIFDWSNRRYPLVDNFEKTTKKVHNYNAVWGVWLK